jgi:hypothetical protein
LLHIAFFARLVANIIPLLLMELSPCPVDTESQVLCQCPSVMSPQLKGGPHHGPGSPALINLLPCRPCRSYQIQISAAAGRERNQQSWEPRNSAGFC